MENKEQEKSKKTVEEMIDEETQQSEKVIKELNITVEAFRKKSKDSFKDEGEVKDFLAGGSHNFLSKIKNAKAKYDDEVTKLCLDETLSEESKKKIKLTQEGLINIMNYDYLLSALNKKTLSQQTGEEFPESLLFSLIGNSIGSMAEGVVDKVRDEYVLPSVEKFLMATTNFLTSALPILGFRSNPENVALLVYMLINITTVDLTNEGAITLVYGLCGFVESIGYAILYLGVAILVPSIGVVTTFAGGLSSIGALLSMLSLPIPFLNILTLPLFVFFIVVTIMNIIASQASFLAGIVVVPVALVSSFKKFLDSGLVWVYCLLKIMTSRKLSPDVILAMSDTVKGYWEERTFMGTLVNTLLPVFDAFVKLIPFENIMGLLKLLEMVVTKFLNTDIFKPSLGKIKDVVETLFESLKDFSPLKPISSLKELFAGLSGKLGDIGLGDGGLGGTFEDILKGGGGFVEKIKDILKGIGLGDGELGGKLEDILGGFGEVGEKLKDILGKLLEYSPIGLDKGLSGLIINIFKKIMEILRSILQIGCEESGGLTPPPVDTTVK